MAHRKVLVAVDDTPHSRIMVDAAFQHVVHRSTDEVHLVTVLPPPSSSASYALAPMATAATVAAVHHNQEVQQQAEFEKGRNVVRLVTDLIAIDYKVPRDNMYAHVLPSEGGASGVSAAVLHLARDIKADLLVVGNRGLGSVTRSIMSLVGLGSVSDAVLRQAPCPLLLVRYDPSKQAAQAAQAEAEAIPPSLHSPKHVCVAYDESSISEAALLWALDNVLSAHDHLYLVSVALSPALLVLAEEEAPLAAMQNSQAREQMDRAIEVATRVVDKAVDLAVSHGVTRTKIVPSVLTPAGGANDVGLALVTYAKEKQLDVMVVGARGMGAVKRSLMSLMGLGSVSEYLAHNVPCALAVVREGVDTSQDPARAAENIAFHVIPEQDEEAAAS